MDETLDRLLDHYGPGAKAVVWAPNTHVGDARATDQSRHGENTRGELVRDRYGAEVVLVGFGTYRGTVVAGEAWGVPPATTRSFGSTRPGRSTPCTGPP